MLFRFVFYDNSVVKLPRISNQVQEVNEITDVNKVYLEKEI
jgi:hypothetical protein